MPEPERFATPLRTVLDCLASYGYPCGRESVARNNPEKAHQLLDAAAMDPDLPPPMRRLARDAAARLVSGARTLHELRDTLGG